MKIEILRENLDKAVTLAAKVSNKNLSLPVLGCVLLVAGDGRAVARATNLDVSVETTLKAKVFTPGVVAVPAHILSQTVSALTDQKLTLTVSGNTLTINGERGTTSITTLDASEFPTLPYVKEGTGTPASIPTRDLTALIRSVAFAASTSSVKPELASISLTLEDKELIAAATDSFRLAEVKIPVQTKSAFSGVLLPARNAADILRALESADENVEIRVGDNQCTFVTEAGYLTSRTIDGVFPDYRAIIPKDAVASATCLREDAIQAFRKISIFTDAFNQVHLSLKPSEKKFTVSSNASAGETVDHIPATLEGEDIDINFNARYITDALSVIGGDSVSFLIAGQGKPMLMTDVPRKGFTYLVMPMNR